MSSSRRAGAAIAALSAALLAGCEASMEEQVAQHRPAVEAVFAKIKALSGPALAAPPLAEDRIDLGGAKVVLEGETSNALFIRAEDLAAPETATSDSAGSTRASTVETCGEGLREDPGSLGLGVPLFLAECARAEYVFVQRTHVHDHPQLLDPTTFQPGRYEGDVLLYRLADGALLGGFRVEGANNAEVSAATDDSGNVIDPSGRLDSDLSAEIYVDIEDGLKKHVPGSIPAG